MAKSTLVIVLLSIMVGVAPLGHGSVPDDDDLSPEAVEKWVETTLPHAKEKLTKLHFFLQKIDSKTPPDSAPVAQASFTAESPTNFGLVNAIDSPLTVSKDPASELVGYSQGLFIFCAYEEASTAMALNFFFTGRSEFAGSTISIVGRNPINRRYREFSVVGGSGEFRLARGIGTASTAYKNDTTGDDALEIHLLVLHYGLSNGGLESMMFQSTK